jgi:hypothetical protein
MGLLKNKRTKVNVLSKFCNDHQVSLCFFILVYRLSFSPFPNKLEQLVLNFTSEGFNLVEKKFEDKKKHHSSDP